MSNTLRDIYLARVVELIAEHGHVIQGATGEGRQPDLHYTVGLTRRGLPELAMLDVGTDLAHVLLNVAAGELTAPMAGGGPLPLSLPTGPVRVMLAPAPYAVSQLDTAVALYGDRIRVLQVALFL